MQSRGWLWLLWTLVVFVLLNIQALPEAANAPPEKAVGFRAFLLLTRDDGDTRRYQAYAQAILGRPYDGEFIRLGGLASPEPETGHAIVTPSRPLIPWRDFLVEYPPGVLIAAVPPALLTSDVATYHFLFCIEMELLLTAAAWLGVRTAERLKAGAGTQALKLSIVYALALGVVGVRHYDALVALSLSVGIYGLTTRRPALAGFALGLGVIAKGVPLILAPLGLWRLFDVERRGDLGRALLAASAICGLSALAYWGLAGDHAADALAYHADRPLQIESLYGAVLMVWHLFQRDLLHITFAYGSHNISASFEPALRKAATATTLLAIMSVYLWYGFARGRARDETERLTIFLAAAAAMLIAYIGLGKVFSPQYMTWLLPIGVISAVLSSERSRVLLISAAAATQIEWPYIYQINSPYAEPLLGAVALTRDLLLIAAAVSLLIDAYPSPVLGVETFGSRTRIAPSPTL